MIRSMTGYGQAVMETDAYRISVEMKSVNHRFLEISFRMPREHIALEDALRKKIGELIKRGKFDVYIVVDRKSVSRKKLTLDWQLASQYIDLVRELKGRYSLKKSPKALELISLPEILKIEEQEQSIEEHRELLVQTVESACQQLLHMRKSEGRTLLEDLTQRIRVIGETLEVIRNRAPLVAKLFRERFLNRLNEIVSGDMDESRLITEVAIFAEKANIDEELVRLESHCQQFLVIMDSEDAVGRKLDFLVQEMNREANTIGSKANDIEISQKVVDLKAELEKIKEQVQNIE
jgi:uncharacterized protein (TIGR00255 family)